MASSISHPELRAGEVDVAARNLLRKEASLYTPATTFSGAERIMSRSDHSVTPSLCNQFLVSHFLEDIDRFSRNLASGLIYHPIDRNQSHSGPSLQI